MTEKDTEVKQYDPTEELPNLTVESDEDITCCEDPASCPCSK